MEDKGVQGEGEGEWVEGEEVEGEGYEVVRVGRLPMLKITHTIFALMRRYSLPVSLPPLLTFSLGYLLLCCHSNSSTAECRQGARKMAALLMTVTQTSSSQDCWKWKETQWLPSFERVSV